MKIRIVQAGYQNFTGEMGHIEFVNGVSVHDVAGTDFHRSLGGIVQVEAVENAPAIAGGEDSAKLQAEAEAAALEAEAKAAHERAQAAELAAAEADAAAAAAEQKVAE